MTRDDLVPPAAIAVAGVVVAATYCWRDALGGGANWLFFAAFAATLMALAIAGERRESSAHTRGYNDGLADAWRGGPNGQRAADRSAAEGTWLRLGAMIIAGLALVQAYWSNGGTDTIGLSIAYLFVIGIPLAADRDIERRVVEAYYHGFHEASEERMKLEPQSTEAVQSSTSRQPRIGRRTIPA
jgi:hypothetical protein